MKVNKSKSPFASDAPDEKDIAKAIKGERFAEALSALESATATTASDSPSNAARAALAAIASQYDLSNEENRQTALRESAEFLVKSRLSAEYKKSEKIIKDLGKFVTDDPFLQSKLLSVLQRLSESKS